MSIHSLAQPITVLQAAESYLPWGRDVRDWVARMQSRSSFDRDDLRRLRAARSVMEGALGEVHAMLENRPDEATNVDEALRDQA